MKRWTLCLSLLGVVFLTLALPLPDVPVQEGEAGGCDQEASQAAETAAPPPVTTAWVRRYSGGSPTGLAVDGEGNVFVCGGGPGPVPGYSYFTTIKYSPSGERLWVRRYNPGNQFAQVAFAIAVDSQGNAYVTGYSCDAVPRTGYLTIKYSPTGERLWLKRYSGPTGDHNIAHAIAVDGDGNAYVTGESKGLGSDYDYATIKYNSGGVQSWVKRYNGTGNGMDGATGIVVDANSNVYVTGYSMSQGPSAAVDYATIKYGSGGGVDWVRRYVYPQIGVADWATALALDGQGNLYVTGSSALNNTIGEFATVKYSPAGVKLWEKRYHGPGNDADGAIAIAVDKDNHVYVTGRSYSATSADIAIIKYTQTP